MKLTTLLMLIILLQVSAKGYSQITLRETNAPLEKVIKAIKAQTGYFFVYNDQQIKTSPITVNVSNVTIEQALEACFKAQPVAYKLVDKNIILQPKAIQMLVDAPEAVNARKIHIHGKVFDENKKALFGATVTIKNDNKLTSTNIYGEFDIANVDDKATVIITFIGLKTKELTAKEQMGDIIMEANVSPLDAVHVIAYGTESRRLSVGAVNTVSAADIARQPVSNPLLALEGLVPGLNITPTSGAPGTAVKVQIRGQNSLNQASSGSKPFDQPLFIVDGVPVAAQNFNVNALLSFGGSDGNLNSFGGASPFNGINPADIESISILKDVSATAIYGTQGANGVILITTKKGKAGKTKVQANVNTAFNSATRTYKLLNAEQYLSYRREALKNDGVNLATASPTAYPDLLLFDQNKNTDWYNYYLGKTSNNTDAHVSLSGGTERTTFLISTGYTNAQYNVPGNFADKRLTLHSNLNYASADNRFTLGFGFDYSYDRNNSAVSPSITTGVFTPPNFPDLLDANGNPVWNYKGYNTGAFVQYAANLQQPYAIKTYNMTNSMILGYRIVSDLKFNLNLGYSRILSDESQQVPARTVNPTTNPTSKATFANSAFETINIEPQLNYNHTFGRGVFNVLIGGTYKKNNSSNVQLQGSQYSDEALLGSIASAGTIVATDSYNPYKYIGAFARLGFTYDQKYIIQLSGRKDGSSNFGPGRQFGNFGSVGLGWIFSEEKFFKSLTQFISYGKLSGSYGTVGTDATAPYRYQQLFKANAFLPNFQGIKPLYVQNLLNPDYGWDTKKSMNIGIDLGFVKDRILLNVNFYRDRIGDQLVNYTLPAQTGFGSVLRNFNAVVQNQGWEFNITSKNISNKDFNWSTSFNISANRNKLISFPGLEQSSYALLYSIGQSVNIVKGYNLKGVNPQTGIYEFYKTNGTVTSSPTYGVPSQGGDWQTIANLDPQFIGGLANTITYKNFSLYFLFQFQRKQQANYLKSIYTGTMPGGLINEPVEMLDRWTKPGDIAPIQKFSNAFSAYLPAYYFSQSTGAYSDGSYIRLRTASLSYTIPSALCKKLGVADANIFVNGQNLFLITSYKVGDPELTSLSNFPIQRTIAFGININF